MDNLEISHNPTWQPPFPLSPSLELTPLPPRGCNLLDTNPRSMLPNVASNRCSVALVRAGFTWIHCSWWWDMLLTRATLLKFWTSLCVKLSHHLHMCATSLIVKQHFIEYQLNHRNIRSSVWMWEIYCEILSVPHNVVTDLNNAMICCLMHPSSKCDEHIHFSPWEYLTLEPNYQEGNHQRDSWAWHGWSNGLVVMSVENTNAHSLLLSYSFSSTYFTFPRKSFPIFMHCGSTSWAHIPN